MIARVWSAQTTPARFRDYLDHLKTQVLPTLKEVDGYKGAMLLERTMPEAKEIIVVTYWQSVVSIRGFAGADLERAVVADEATALLDHYDHRVRHYEVALMEDFLLPKE
jgi:heme-degrading monooxygenase HmoA